MLTVIRSPHKSKALLNPCVMTIGNFDGLHLGHRKIIEKVVSTADALNGIPTVLTFEPLPQNFLRPNRPLWRIMTLRQKLALLAQWGIRQVVCLKFNAQLAQLSPQAFIENYLLTPLKIRHLIVGQDFRFGHQQLGNISLLQQAAAQNHFTLEALNLSSQNGHKISSTQVRQALLAGDLKTARAMLGRNYSLDQKVVKGSQRARIMGFPTANLFLGRYPLFRGVFVTKARVAGQYYDAVTNVGTRPTIDGKNYLAETHLLDFSGDLYGKRMQVEFLYKLRDEIRFANVSELEQQIAQDILIARRFLQNNHSNLIEINQ